MERNWKICKTIETAWNCIWESDNLKKLWNRESRASFNINIYTIQIKAKTKLWCEMMWIWITLWNGRWFIVTKKVEQIKEHLFVDSYVCWMGVNKSEELIAIHERKKNNSSGLESYTTFYLQKQLLDHSFPPTYKPHTEKKHQISQERNNIKWKIKNKMTSCEWVLILAYTHRRTVVQNQDQTSLT